MWHRNHEVFQALAGELTTKSSSKSTGRDRVDAFGWAEKQRVPALRGEAAFTGRCLPPGSARRLR